MKQRFDTSLDQVEELQETIFDEPTGPIRKRRKRLLAFSFGLTSVLVGAYILVDYLILHFTVVIFILAIIPIYAIWGFLVLAWFLIEKWWKLHFYPGKVKAEAGLHNELYVPVRINITMPAPSSTDLDLSTSSDMLELLQQSDEHVLILGSPGAGKTIALRVYQQRILKQRRWRHIRDWHVPVLISLKDYNAFLKSDNVLIASGNAQNRVDDELPAISSPRMLRDYLYYHNELESVRSLRPYLPQLIKDGRVVLLCDGLNEVDSAYQEELCAELSELMRQNRVIMTCRELDYHNPIFETLVSEQGTRLATIKPLERDQQDGFIQQYFQKEYTIKQADTWQNASDNVIRIIDTKKLRPECGNPFILSLLTRTLHSIGTTKEINTRGQLFREAMSLLVGDGKRQLQLNHPLFEDDDLLLYLGEIACTIRRMKCRNGLRLPDMPSKIGGSYYSQAADALTHFTDQHPVEDSEAIDRLSIPEPTAFPREKRIEMLKFAVKAPDLMFISHSEHVLSFSHELMAEYFVAEYLHRMYDRGDKTTLPYGKELISTEGDWNESIRIWAGLLDDPMSLADHLGKMGLECQYDEDGDRSYNALTLGMMCVGVLWVHTPSSILQQDLPSSLYGLLNMCISDEERRDHLKTIFERCAQEGGDSVYRPLLKVLTLGAGELLLALPRQPIHDLLFEHLASIAGGTYENEVRSLVSILGRMGSFVVERAVELSKPSATKSIRLRRAAISILGYTRDANAVAPLLGYLDERKEIADEAIAAFQRLGPDIALGPLRQELISIADLKAKKRQIEILKVLNILLLSDDVKLIQYKDCIKDLLAVLSSPDLSVQQEAKSLLIREARSNRTRAQEVKEELTLALSLSDPIIIRNVVEILERIGHEATKHLLNHLKSSEATNTMRVHIVKILGDVQDFSALPELHNRVAAASSALRTQVAIALCNYPMEKVVPELIEKVLHFSNDEAIAARNALVHFGRKGVELIVQHLFDKAKPSRVALLVQTLRSLEDERAVPYLIELMVRLRAQPPSFLAIEAVESLTINVVNALASFKSVFVVDALLNILNTWPLDTYKKVYTQASLGLSSQGEQALPTLLGALDVEKTEVSTEGVLHAIDMMKPFPEGALLNALGYRSDAQVRYIISIFVKRGKEEAPFLVQQLCHKNTRVQSCVHQILEQLDAEAVVEPLLEMLSDDVFRSAVIQHLRRYPDTVIPRLVELLGDAQLGETAVQVLIEFDVLVIERLRSLVRAFDDKNGGASLHAEQVFVELVKGHETLLLRVVELFRTITGDEHAYEALVHMLSTSLAYGSMPILLRELASKHPFMMRGVIDTLVRLGRENDEYSEGVICELIAALSVAEKRPQAEKALERIGERAVSHVEPLAIGKDLETRQSARNILSKMGPLAFGVLFSFLSSHDSERRSAAESIIANMETKDIKDPLLQLLSDQDVQRVEQSLVLLLGRIRADVRAPSGQQKMLTVLLEHIQTHESDRTTVLILNFLLLLPERKQLLETFNQVLSRYRRTQQWFMPLFLLMNIEGNEARANLLRLLQREAMTPTLEKEFVGILGMLEPNELVTKYATSIGDFAQLSGSPFLNNQVFQVERSRRAVGSLLASDYWNTERLQELQNREPVGSVRHELFTVLSGGSYVPAMLSLQEKLNEKVEALQKAEEDIAQLHRDVDQRDRQLRDANNQKATLKREKTSLSQEITNLREENASLRQENANLRNRGIPPGPPFRPRF